MPVIVFALAVLLAAQSLVRTFDDDNPGAPPGGFELAVGREATPDRWVVSRDGANHVLAHLGGSGPRDGFAVAVYAGSQYRDGEISVRLKTTGGSRVAGLVWKYRDPQNHYVAQLNLATQELAIYRVVGGNRIRVEREDDLELDPDGWHSLRVVQNDDQMRVYLGGIRVFSDRDRTLGGPGYVGLWAANDAGVLFDDFRVRPSRRDHR
jgi:hypothetical protein